MEEIGIIVSEKVKEIDFLVDISLFHRTNSQEIKNDFICF